MILIILYCIYLINIVHSVIGIIYNVKSFIIFVKLRHCRYDRRYYLRQ